MGNSTNQTTVLPKYEWIWVGNHTGIDLFKRQSDSLIAQRRIITLDNRFALETELQIYQFRSNNNHGLVKVYQVDGVQNSNKSEQKSSLCGCSGSKILNVYSQRIEYRLSDLPQLTFPQSLHMLRETLNSFHHVYQKFGPLHVNSQLIGISDQNKVRVWVNENWALNHPSHKIPVLLTINNLHLPPQLRDEREMVTNIIQVIEQKTEQGRFHFQFAEGMYANAVNFRESKRFLAKYINQDFQDYIPAIIKRSTVLASQRQIGQYNSSISHPVTSTPYIDTNVKIVQSMYQQYNKGNNLQPSDTSQIVKSNLPSNSSEQKVFPIVSNTVLNFGNYSEPLPHLPQRQPTPLSHPPFVFPPPQVISSINQSPPIHTNHTLNQSFNQRVITEGNQVQNFNYLKFKLIDEDKTSHSFSENPQINQNLFGKQKIPELALNENHLKNTSTMLNSDPSESSQHKASYKIVQMRKEGEFQKVR